MAIALTWFRQQLCPNDHKYVLHIFTRNEAHSYTIATFTCLDARIIAYQSNRVMVYTSPNMLFVPKPHLDNEELHAQANGQFGTVDCFQWPQVYCKEHKYAVCIPWQEHYPHPDSLSWAWYTPSLKDFIILPIAAFAFGRKQEKVVNITFLHYIIFTWYAI